MLRVFDPLECNQSTTALVRDLFALVQSTPWQGEYADGGGLPGAGVGTRLKLVGSFGAAEDGLVLVAGP